MDIVGSLLGLFIEMRSVGTFRALYVD